MSTLIDQWLDIAQLGPPVAALIYVVFSFWRQSRALKEANEALREATEAALRAKLMVKDMAIPDSEVVRLSQQIDALQLQIEQLKELRAARKKQSLDGLKELR